MPTLIRFAIICVVLIVGVYAAMFALATFVEPSQKETTIRVPLERLTSPEP
jgi:hypothetical protein